MGFSKKVLIFLKSLKVVNLLWNAYHMVIIFENVFSALIMSYFWQKKTENFERWKS